MRRTDTGTVMCECAIVLRKRLVGFTFVSVSFSDSRSGCVSAVKSRLIERAKSFILTRGHACDIGLTIDTGDLLDDRFQRIDD